MHWTINFFLSQSPSLISSGRGVRAQNTKQSKLVNNMEKWIGKTIEDFNDSNEYYQNQLFVIDENTHIIVDIHDVCDDSLEYDDYLNCYLK